MVYMSVPHSIIMKQILLTKQELVPLQKEQTLRQVLENVLIEKGLDSSLVDLASKHVLFSVDGVIPNNGTTRLSVAETLDLVVKPTQEVRLLPAQAGG